MSVIALALGQISHYEGDSLDMGASYAAIFNAVRI